MTDLHKLELVRQRAAEQAAIESIPKPLLEQLEQANAKFAAKGGCPGCGSQQIAIHYGDCPTSRGDLY